MKIGNGPSRRTGIQKIDTRKKGGATNGGKRKGTGDRLQQGWYAQDVTDERDVAGKKNTKK